MDITQEYITMCTKATMLQHFKTQHGFGDVLYRDGKIWFVNGYNLSEGCNEYRAITNVDDSFPEQWFAEGLDQTIWLPRQDQLQKIATNANIALPYLLVEMFPEFVAEDVTQFEMTTPEKYWLMFIMDLVYCQYWCTEKQNWIDKPNKERKIITQ